MEDLLQYIPLILIALFSLLRVFRKKTRQQPEPDEQEVTLPLWDNFPATEDASDEPLPEFLEIEKPSVAQEPVVQLPAVEDSQPAHETTPSKSTQRPVPQPDGGKGEPSPAQSVAGTIAGISLTPQTVRQGIILSEILGRPKSLRRPPVETEN